MRTQRPKLTTESVVDYLDWVADNFEAMNADTSTKHLAAAELAIRTLAIEAQNKATQHTLVQDGTMKAPTL